MLTGKALKKRTAMVRDYTISTLFFAFGFIFSWLPYACVSMYTAFINSEGVGDGVFGTLPAIFAKSSIFVKKNNFSYCESS